MFQESDTLVREYKLNGPVALKLIHDGIDNSVYFVTDSVSRKYILRESKRPHVNRSANFESAVISMLIKAGVSTPAIIPAVNGEPSIVIANRDATLFEYVPGTQFFDVTSDLIDRRIIDVGARALGQMHAVTRGYMGSSMPKRSMFTEFERFMAVKDNPILTNLEGYGEFASSAADFWKRAVRMMGDHTADLGIIHNDYRIQNLIFQDDTRCSIIDFDWACPGSILKDVGLAIAEWSMFDFAVNRPSQAAIDAFIAGYNKTAPAVISYDSDLLFWICFSCLSDACTFFVDLVEGRHQGKTILRTEQCRMYRKFKYFRQVAA